MFAHVFDVGLLFIVAVCAQTINAFQPEFAEPVVNISVAVGRDATFTCHVRHLGGYRVGWVKADTKAIQAIHEHVITHNHRVSVSHSDQFTWNLHIKSVEEEDRGGYMCQLNTDPMKSQMGYLDVVIPPDFISEDTSSDVIMPEGSTVKLTCRARGYPEPIVTWRREDGNEIVLKDSSGVKQLVTSFRGEVLKLTKIARGEMGAYLCIASNFVPPSVSKRISLSIHFTPAVRAPNQLVGAPLGTDVTIECHVESSPKSINYWIKDTGEMIVSSTKHHVEESTKSLYETKMVLRVRHFDRNDVGSYRCIAKNSLGEVDSNIRLYEIPGSTRKHTPSMIETNDVVRNKVSLHTATTSSSSATASGKPSSSVSLDDDLYRSSYEDGDVDEGAEGDDEEQESEDANSRYVSITRTTANSYTKHVPTNAGRQPPAMPPLFVGPELISNSLSATLPVSIKRTTVALFILQWWWWTRPLAAVAVR